MRSKLVAGIMVLGATLGMGAVAASAHPIETPGHTGGVGGSSQGHTHGLECAARNSPVLGELGLPCAADGRN